MPIEPTLTLPGGVRLLVEHLPHVHSAAIGFWVDTGSEREAPENNGICHFLEHMLFKGTARRTAHEIAQSLEASGGQLNAFTDKEHTCFHARVLDSEVELAIDVLGDMLRHSAMDAKEVKRERAVVIEEIKMYDDTPDDLVHELIAELLWPEHPLGRPVTGTRKSVAKFDRTRCVEFMADHYTPDRMVVAITGNVDPAAVTAQVAQVFAGYETKGVEVARPALVARAASKVTYRDIEQAHLCIATPSISMYDDRRYAQALLDAILGGGMASRLFQEIREKRGLVYSVGSYEALFRQGGLFAVSAGMSPKHLPTVLDLIHEELAKAVAGDITEKELADAKRQLRGSLLLSLEVPRHRMSRMAQNELYYSRQIPPDETLAAIDAVTTADLQALSAELFDPAKFSTAIVGPLRKLPARAS